MINILERLKSLVNHKPVDMHPTTVLPGNHPTDSANPYEVLLTDANISEDESDDEE